MAEPLGIALVGCGTVGSGVVKILQAEAERIRRWAGRPLELRKVLVKNRDKPRPVSLDPTLFAADWAEIVNDPNIHVVAELVGGTGFAKTVALDTLKAGKNLVTANKALLAEHGPELFATARQAEKSVAFEAAVAGGIPIIKAMAESLAADRISAIQGILNGTSNFILSAMANDGADYSTALAQAQELGYAEADPTLDVDGTDAAHKLAILAQIAFGVTAKPDEIERQGIDRIDPMDVRFAAELGYTLKLLAEAWVDGSSVALHVAPVMLRRTDMLAQVRGAFNAIQVLSEYVGESLFQGPGAGMMPTANSVINDLIDVAVGRTQRTFSAAKLWDNENRGYTLEPSELVRSRFYLRLLIRDRSGVLADVCRTLAERQISIASVIQHESQDGHPDQVVPLVIMTHAAETGLFRQAVTEIDKLGSMTAPAVYYSVGG